MKENVSGCFFSEHSVLLIFGVAPTMKVLEVDRISASVLVSAPNVDKWALSADIRFRPKAVVSHPVHFRFRRAAVGKFGGCRK